jgi:hypothetical protein
MSVFQLEVNDAGGWRRVMAFDADADALDEITCLTHTLLMKADNHRLRARIMEAGGGTAPKLTWTRETWWRHWRRGE